MKKLFLFMLALILSIGCVFAVNGKILAGGNFGFIPELGTYQFDATGRWRMDYVEGADFTADLVGTVGVISDFEKVTSYNMFFGAGLTKQIADKWNVFASAGLDSVFGETMKNLGVAANAGFEYEVKELITINCQVKLSQYIPSKVYAFKPSIGCTYTF